MPKLITTSETAELLGVSPSTVGRMVERGELAAYQFPNGTLRFDEHEIFAWLKQCRIDNQPKDDIPQ